MLPAGVPELHEVVVFRQLTRETRYEWLSWRFGKIQARLVDRQIGWFSMMPPEPS